MSSGDLRQRSLRVGVGEQVGVGDARTDRVDRDGPGAELHRGNLGELLDRGLAGGVRGDSPGGRTPAQLAIDVVAFCQLGVSGTASTSVARHHRLYPERREIGMGPGGTVLSVRRRSIAVGAADV